MIIKKVEDQWVFAHGKYEGKSIEEVVEDDPNYIKWAYQKASDDLPDEAYYALEDLLEENDIEV